ncbi:Aluminum-activated malate transporter 9 [Acorus gramineus]|uniref:Aluminum-activated malate transporter 9 n=1 Tax=Acorus gramineus TaxID=55184 RepID=A0AAV9BNW6_ACOGR|nr:Aluminum-activated malate transporter 9 [Acorus gramineus]
MVPKRGSFRYTFTERSKERLLSMRESEAALLGFHNCIAADGAPPASSSKGIFRRFSDGIIGSWARLNGLFVKAWKFGRSDPRKVVFAAKMGLALTLLSVLIFLKVPFKDLGTHAVWALLTVVVIFEFSIGATLSKGFNRALGTLSAGGLALGMAALAVTTGELEEVVIVISIFITGFLATFIKLYPTMKPYEYGFRVFLLTYCFIMVSGYRTREFIETAVTRFLLIALGAGVGLVVNICIYPIWAGEDLHNLVAKNFASVANSLEGCVTGYLQCVAYDRIPSKILTYQALEDPMYSGYRTAVEATSQEETLLGFAIWEPPHGPYKNFKYPWKNYVKVSGALRHCAFTVMALHGCVLSEIQAPQDLRQVFGRQLQRIGTEGAKVLRELGNRVKTMTKLDPDDILLEVHEAAEQLQMMIDQRSYLLVNSESWVGVKRPENIGETLDGLHVVEGQNKHLEAKSLSETVLDLNSVQIPWNWYNRNSNAGINSFNSATVGSPEMILEKQMSWPSQRNSFQGDGVPGVEESNTYESARALSLATYASLLIEFAARLQNLVDSFKELSEKANFREPVVELVAEKVGFWTRLRRRLRFED